MAIHLILKYEHEVCGSKLAKGSVHDHKPSVRASQTLV